MHAAEFCLLMQPHTATVAAIIVCEEQQAVNLRPLLASLELQNLPPSEAVVLCDLDSDDLLSHSLDASSWEWQK